MSDRLSIGKQIDSYEISILSSDSDEVISEKIQEWARCNPPWKIRITDFDLFDKIVNELNEAVWYDFPDDIWGIFADGREPLWNPTEKELRKWRTDER